MYRVPSRGRSRPPARRKPTEERRAEIVAAACEIALADGLDCLTLRRIADALGVFPGLVSHYFPSVEYLVAEAFADVMTQDRNETFAMIEAAAPAPLARMRAFLRYMLSDDRDRISLLWLDAWHGARQRPALQVALVAQMQSWESRLAALVQEGAATGEFRTADPLIASTRILAAVDGLTVVAAIKSAINNSDVGDLVIATAERELGLRPGQLAATDR
jgi:AcrR family transcriptional regulator